MKPIAPYTREEGDRPASVREVEAIRRELRVVQDQMRSVMSALGKRFGLRFDEARPR